VSESLASVKFKVRAQIIWVKTRFAIGRGNYHWQHEPSFYATKEGDLDDGWRFVDDHESAAYVVKDGKTANWEGGRKQSTVWFIEHIKSETGHSTQKPVECMARPIRNNSSPGQAVYEPFSGSGTTIIACEMEGRACYAVELNPPYVDMAIKRWQNFTGKQAVRESDGVTFDEALKDHGKSSA
jgi:DNA modification methylase